MADDLFAGDADQEPEATDQPQAQDGGDQQVDASAAWGGDADLAAYAEAVGPEEIREQLLAMQPILQAGGVEQYIQQQSAERMMRVLRTPEGRQVALELLGVKQGGRQQDELDLEAMTPTERALAERLARTEQLLAGLRPKVESAAELADAAQTEQLATRISTGYNDELSSFYRDQPEARQYDHVLRKRLGQAIKSDLVNNGGPGWVRRAAAAQYRELLSELQIGRPQQQRRGVQPQQRRAPSHQDSFDPTALSQEEASDIMVQMIRQRQQAAG